LKKDRYQIGVDLGGTNIKSGIVQMPSGRVIVKRLLPTQTFLGKDIIIANIKKSINGLMEYAEKRGMEIDSIGLGCPGTVDVPTGKIMGMIPNLPQLKNTNIKEELRKEFHPPIYVDNDANLMGLAEHRFGAARGFQNCLFLTIGTGIGGGIILNGKIFRGSKFAGAEFGHTSIKYDGRKCRCGNVGCVESYAAAPAIGERTKRLLRKEKSSLLVKWVKGDLKKLTNKLIFEAFKKGDNLAAQVVEEVSVYLGTAIASAVNLLNPEVVVIGGGVGQAGKKFIEKIEYQVKKRINPPAGDFKMKKASLGNDAGFIGAAILSETIKLNSPRSYKKTQCG
jgi:glucokinase